MPKCKVMHVYQYYSVGNKFVQKIKNCENKVHFICFLE